MFQVDERGNYSLLGNLNATEPHGYVLDWASNCPWPLIDEEQEGRFEGLPYFLQDLWPEGFLGQAFARAYGPLLGLAPDPGEWTEEDALQALSRFGADAVGNHIIGSAALELYLDGKRNPRQPLIESDVAAAYTRLADMAMAGAKSNAIVPGVFPKFTASRAVDGTCLHVLVKFSGSENSPSSRRWSDLLVCEHLASRVLHEFGVPAAETRIVQHAGRTFLESVRFDRHGAHGRSAVCSLAAINYAWLGLPGRAWAEGAAALLARGLIEPTVVETVARVWCFGKLIANSDMHDGNLSFKPHRIGSRRGFELAPIYDMLPMQYAPVRGRVPLVNFEPSQFLPPAPAEQAAWADAAAAALQFWEAAARDPCISKDFRAICAENCDRLYRAIHLAGGAPRA